MQASNLGRGVILLSWSWSCSGHSGLVCNTETDRQTDRARVPGMSEHYSQLVAVNDRDSPVLCHLRPVSHRRDICCVFHRHTMSYIQSMMSSRTTNRPCLALLDHLLYTQPPDVEIWRIHRHVPPPKIREKYFSCNCQVKFGNLVKFSGKHHVKFGHFVNFSYIIFRKIFLPPPPKKKVDWAPTPMGGFWERVVEILSNSEKRY